MDDPNDAQCLTWLMIRSGMTEAQLAHALNEAGVSVSQASINRIKLGKQKPGFDIGMGLVRLIQSRAKSPRRATSALSA